MLFLIKLSINFETVIVDESLWAYLNKEIYHPLTENNQSLWTEQNLFLKPLFKIVRTYPHCSGGQVNNLQTGLIYWAKTNSKICRLTIIFWTSFVDLRKSNFFLVIRKLDSVIRSYISNWGNSKYRTDAISCSR